MKPSRFGFAPQEHHVSALPAAIASVMILGLTVFNGSFVWPQGQFKSSVLFLVGIAGIFYIVIFHYFLIPGTTSNPILGWVNAVLSSFGLGLLTYTLPHQMDIYPGVLLILAVITSAIVSERGPSYLMVLLTTFIILVVRNYYSGNIPEWTFQLSLAVLSIILIETIRQLKNRSRDHIRRLEIITEFGRQIASAIDRKEVLALLNVAFRNAMEADTYFVGIRDGNELRLELIYDDGETYENQHVRLDGTLSSWVLNNQESLFLPDLRKEVTLPGMRLVLAGKHKTSLSWMGVPVRSDTIDGIMSIGSYRPNAFDKADLELLSNLAQYTSQALHNTYHHEEVELRSQLDSLTGVYNHGNFLKILKEQADESIAEGRSLSLIMLDVDYFKRYNDTYGHLVGDDVLTSLCATIKKNIKSTDAVGRWGGEEFAISLPNTNAVQARQIAERIRDTLRVFTMRNLEQKTFPVPTVSQGIAVFPAEADEIIKLVDLADRRLYVAKERGRNQIEPSPVKQDQEKVDKSE
ncbi:MAG TPA: sensor domain-containing diguanylate cyclase [Anaerolineales bacterium]|jgi:diguanylate cyclase (GGDEF)-like protein|nr:sensor domain-containing diguanylate cyclase [Anaerolineales bacterium]